jgi:hypothetical protein
MVKFSKIGNASRLNGYGRCSRTGKIRFPDKQTAYAELRDAIARGREERRVYECPHCQKWHLTHLEEIPNE